MTKSHLSTKVLLLIVVTCVGLGRNCSHDFTWWDDDETIHHNPKLNPPTIAGVAHYWRHPFMSLYVPVTYTVWGALASIAQLDAADDRGITLNPWIFHTANVAVHLLNALLVFAILRLLCRRDWPACLGAMLFAIHPVQVETVAWVSGMKDLLCGLFTLTAIWQFILFVQRQRRLHYWLALLAMALGLLSKPTAVVMPLLAFVIDVWLLGRKPKQSLRALAPFLVLMIAWMIVTKIVQPSAGVMLTPLWTRPLVATDTLAFYLYKLAFPAWLALDYGRRPMLAMKQGWIYWTWILPAAVGVGVWIARRRNPWLLAALLLFMGGMAPVLGLSGFVYQYYSTTADHYMYLPMLGAATALAFLLAKVESTPKWPMVRGACAILLGALTIRSFFQSAYWRDNYTLHMHILDVTPHSYIAYNNLAAQLTAERRYAEAMDYLWRAIEVNPEHWKARENLSMYLTAQGRIDEAIEQQKQAMRIRSTIPRGQENFPETLNSFAMVLMSRGRYAEAIEQLDHALRLKPRYQAAQKNLEISRARLTEASTRPATTTAPSSP